MTWSRTIATVGLFCLCLLGTSNAVRAAVVAATLYPGAALVTEEQTLALVPDGELLSGTVTLPQAAEPGTLTLNPGEGSGLTLAGTSVRTVKRRDEGRIREVVAALTRERTKRQSLADALTSRTATAAFWQTQASAAQDKTAEAKAMAAALRDGLTAELAAASGLRRELVAQDEVVTELEKELERLTGGAEAIHEVTVFLAGAAAASVPVRFSYRLRNAGWQPQYVLNALPAQGQVQFSWDAVVRQASGRDWTHVALSLATAELRRGATPPPLPTWELRPMAPPMMLRQKSTNAVLTRAPLAEMDEAAQVEASPPRTEGAVFDTYDAGRVTLASGDSKRLKLSRETWAASFDHLIRPYAEPRAYLRAALALDKAPRIPSGRADFLLEGALVQKLPFSLYEAKTDLFFGADRQIAVDFQPKERKSGEFGLFGGKHKYGWTWTLAIKNGKAVPARIRVEDSLPRQGDERIKIERNTGGGKAEDDGTSAWEFQLPPGAGHLLEYGYEATWPGDMELDLGGR